MARWDAFGEGALEHLGGDAGDAGERAGEEELQAESEGVEGAFGGQEAEIECGVDFEVLHVKPGGCAGGLGDEESDGRAEEGGLDGEDDVGLPEELLQDYGQAAEHEGDEMRDALEAGGLGGNVEGRAVDDGFGGVLASSVFGAVEFAAVVFADAPCGVVRGCCDDADFVASCR